MTQTKAATFQGTPAELARLQSALARVCSCEDGSGGEQPSDCPAHVAFFTDQRFLDGLLWELRLNEQRDHEEHGEQEPMLALPPYPFPQTLQGDPTPK